MLKTVTCGRGAVARAAQQHHVVVLFAEAGDGTESRCPVEADVVARPTAHEGEVALLGKTLAGDLFLSLLVAGAC
jgi:hypothetical protein